VLVQHDQATVIEPITEVDAPKVGYTRKSLWRKVTKFAGRAGREVIEKVLLLFYVSQSEHLPKRFKIMVVTALTYFVSTIDAIPDITPVLGFADDLGVLTAAVAALATWINPQVRAKVDDKLKAIFSPASNSALQDANLLEDHIIHDNALDSDQGPEQPKFE